MKVVAFSLWGDAPMYNIGAIKNANLVQEVYGDSWTSRFYLSNDVPQETIDELNKIPNTQCVVMGDPEDWYGTFWRFLAVDDSDIAIFRDTDSRISEREYVSVLEWLETGAVVHIMRDHPHHSETILAGMWGCRSKDLITLINENQYKKNNLPEITTLKESITHWIDFKIHESVKAAEPHNYKGNDQKYLREVVYPNTYRFAHIHDSFPIYNPWSNRMETCGNIRENIFGPPEHNTGFPLSRKRVEKNVVDFNDFVGQVYDENDIPNEEYEYLIRERDNLMYKDGDKI